MAKQENNYFRNLHHNYRHREWGYRLSMMDVDNLEYDSHTGKVVALIETKYGLENFINLNDQAYDILCELAGNRPVFLVIFYPLKNGNQLMEHDDPPTDLISIQYRVVGVNDAGKAIVPAPTNMSERAYVNVLRRLRGLSATDQFSDKFVLGLKTPTIINRP